MASSWRTKLLWILVVAAGLTLIIAGLYAEENARGLRAWEQCQRDLAARGESIAWTNFLPTPVPDDQNFYKAPKMTEWFIGCWNTDAKAWIQLLQSDSSYDATNFTDESASNFLAFTAPYETNFALIREAVKRPSARLPGDYTTSNSLPLPELASFRTLTFTLAHQAECHLIQGNSSRALDDLKLMYDLNSILAKTGKPEEIINTSIYGFNLRHYTWVIARGIQAHAWTEPQLILLQKQLADVDILPLGADAMRAERAELCRELDTLPLSKLMSDDSTNFCWWFVPSGWVHENEAKIAQYQQAMVDCYVLTNHSIMSGKMKALDSAIQNMWRNHTPGNIGAAIYLLGYRSAVKSVARNQTWIDQAQIACALERYHLIHGQYPPDLAPLAPQFIAQIPHDIINGKPMIYVRQSEQNFLLYSVGWNEIDDGGFIAHNSDGREDNDNGDWVWHYPAN